MDRHRAIYMLKVAAKYIRENHPDGKIHYDEADCDGSCVANDCEYAADELKGDLDKIPLSSLKV
jgi:hypothetical protein